MATQNKQVTKSWTEVSTVSVVITPNEKTWSMIEFATATALPAGIMGTPLKNGESAAVSVGSGEKVYARSVGVDNSVTLVLELIV